MTKLLRITTVPVSLKILLKGQHRYFSNYYEVLGVSSPGKGLTEVGTAEGIRVVSVPMERQVSLVRDMVSLIRLIGLIRREKPFIVHTHTPKAGTLGMVAAWLCAVPVRMHTVAGLPLMEAVGAKRKILDFVEKITYACATRVYPNSYGLQKIILDNGYTNVHKLKVLANGSSNGIDTEYFCPALYTVDEKKLVRQSLGLSESDFVFVFVGRLVKDKGINELVEAFISMKSVVGSEELRVGCSESAGSICKLLLVGPEEPELDPLEANTLAEIRNNKDIVSVGWQADVRPYLAIANVLVFPSYREGFPNVVMQAGAMGLPAIVTDINGCNEIIVEGENGVIVPVKDSVALRRKMCFFMDNNAELMRMAANARPMIVNRYEQHIVWEALLEEYKRFDNL
ncbi:MAG: glycosyltransferase family 4 protein [Paludibacter sp.]|jgi:glycosyltransferase involved in cell wall biosynthesis|nr:glycosyltransferase family 4 protein [Paludibacter sp.]